jgi:hypothetical protein
VSKENADQLLFSSDTLDYTDGFNIRPNPFKCSIRIRSEEHKRVLEKEKEEADKEMEKFPAYD